MSMNPIAYTEKVVSDFLKYQITTFPFADARLHAQLRELLSLDKTRDTPLLMGPYVSLSRSFRMGASVERLVTEGILHPHMKELIPFHAVYGHQEEAIRSIVAKRSTLVSTGTGSGKTECFLYPIISRCLTLRDERADPGIVAVLVYPMNALAEDQLGRMRALLAGSGISFGMYVGKTPEARSGVTGKRLAQGSSRADYLKAVEKSRDEERKTAVHPPEERCSREEMRAPGGAPRILLTNVKQMELLLTRQKDVELFAGARLEFLVFDEAHTFSGSNGAETACLIRRLRAYCGRRAQDTVCVGTSATIADPRGGTEAGKDFAARFFGVSREHVDVVGEAYAEDVWASPLVDHVIPKERTAELLARTLAAVGNSEGETELRSVARDVLHVELAAGPMEEALHHQLSRSLVGYKLAEALKRPLKVGSLITKMSEALSREVSESELMIWLALGAAARKDGRPLLRPVVHAFIRGIGGAVVSFPPEADGPRLHLSAEQEPEHEDELVRLPITTCTTCGQHAFVHFANGLEVNSGGLGGGQATGTDVRWESLEEVRGGARVVLMDPLVGGDDHANQENTIKGVEAYLCRFCGCIHATALQVCLGCGRADKLVALTALRWNDDNPGYMTSCPGCGTPGRNWGTSYREPARPVRAVAVSDVHVLAQNMIQFAERPRLLVFADNRQEAAFQAGWMKDHARRFRLRALMDQLLREAPRSVGDLTAELDRRLEGDDNLSRSLAPEVWRFHRKEGAGVEHRNERKVFLRIMVLREITTGLKQRIGLEPWGRLVVHYLGLEPDLPFFQSWAKVLNLEPERLRDGVAAVLDRERRHMILLDREGKLFSRFWMDGDLPIQRGYIPRLSGVPTGLKIQRTGDDDKGRVAQWISARGQTAFRQDIRAWGVSDADVEQFVKELWKLLTQDLRLLAPVTLQGARGNPLPRCSDVRQVDADQLLLQSHKGRWRCQSCRRSQIRPTPRDACMAYRCSGTLIFEQEDPDNYDLVALDRGYAMVKPEEHSAQVPAEQRDRIERSFKGDGDAINTLVCTPTLELGIDIGGLDAVMMRNVPPLPSNYWQRAGRAGRRHRLAVALTYARSVSHDLAYFRDPLKLLEGKIEPPKFNLRNDLMVRKHVHAAVLTRLYMLGRESSGLEAGEREEIRSTLEQMLPPLVRDYLFTSESHLRDGDFDLTPLKLLIEKHRTQILDYVKACFFECWPSSDAEAVEITQLEQYVKEMDASLDKVLGILRRRLRWCLEQISRLNKERSQKGTLDLADDALFRRCDRMVKRLKGMVNRKSSESEGYDDSVTFGVLAAEGFLPGYGLDTGTIRATALASRVSGQSDDFPLPRPKAMALREYVPGNLIYANGDRFVARHYHLEPETTRLGFLVDSASEAVTAVDDTSQQTSLLSDYLPAVAICDVELPHYSHISDDEDFRFQMGVAVYGMTTGNHGAGAAYIWGHRPVHFRSNVGLRLVNAGPTNLVAQGTLGYPLCRTCGDSRSALSSQREQKEFVEHHQKRCGNNVGLTGFYADITADALSLPDCPTRAEAWSLIECLRIGMSRVLEMEREDLMTLVIGRSGSDQVDAFLYDPMPGGSGLLQQAMERWEEVIAEAKLVASECSSACSRSCPDCLQNFRNAYYHAHLDRKLAEERLVEFGLVVTKTHDIAAKAGPVQDEGVPVNAAEALLKLLIFKAGLPTGIWHKRIEIGLPYRFTEPDVYWDDPEDANDPGLAVYLDGLSQQLHGNPSTRDRDLAIRQTLRSKGYDVVEIPASHLQSKDSMVLHVAKIAKFLFGRERAKELRSDTSWFESSKDAEFEVASAGVKVGTFDPDLYPAPWQLLLANIASVPGIRVEPGAEVACDGRVLGSFVAELSGPSGEFCLLDAGDEYVVRCEEAIRSDGKQALKVDPSDPESFSSIMKAVGGS